MNKKTLLRNNDGRRSGKKNDRRIFLHVDYSPERRSGKDRRSRFDRRSKQR